MSSPKFSIELNAGLQLLRAIAAGYGDIDAVRSVRDLADLEIRNRESLTLNAEMPNRLYVNPPADLPKIKYSDELNIYYDHPGEIAKPEPEPVKINPYIGRPPSNRSEELDEQLPGSSQNEPLEPALIKAENDRGLVPAKKSSKSVAKKSFNRKCRICKNGFTAHHKNEIYCHNPCDGKLAWDLKHRSKAAKSKAIAPIAPDNQSVALTLKDPVQENKSKIDYSKPIIDVGPDLLPAPVLQLPIGEGGSTTDERETLLD